MHSLKTLHFRHGATDGWTFGGGGLIADPSGTVLPSAGVTEEGLITADIDRDNVVAARIAFPNRRDRQPDLSAAITAAIDP